jgi:DNA invertase Pin-like site-specific DNA recombinase
MKVAIYARVPSERQEVDLSIGAQLREIREYAAKNSYQVVQEYVDEVESGRTADRPQFQGMIADARRASRPFQLILVWKYARFAETERTPPSSSPF